MRFAFLLAALALAGCPDGTQPPVTSDFDDAGCKITCDKCPDGTTCVTLPYDPVCLVDCDSDGTCPGGGVCAKLQLPGLGVANQSPMCVVPLRVTACEVQTCDIAPMCQDDQTLLTPLTFKNICGWQLQHCDSGCDSANGTCK